MHLKFPHADNWKIHLIKLFNYTDKGWKYFKAYGVTDLLDLTPRHIYKHINRFISLDFIHSPERGKFFFTKKGIDFVEDKLSRIDKYSKFFE